MSKEKPRVVIIGGGFAGINAAQALGTKDVEIVVLDKRNYHLFQPLLYQVATAGLSPADIAAPIRGVLRNQKNARVILGHAKRIDQENKQVILEDGEIEYDYLVIATGMNNNYFGHDEWEKAAPGLKSLEEAVDIRRRLLLAFEAAEYTEDSDELLGLLTFVIIGAGPTGVEMAGAISEIASEVMVRDFRNVDSSKARVILIEGQDRVLSAFSEQSSAAAKKALEGMGVEIVLNTFVKDITDEGVQAGDKFIPCRNAIWAAGLKAGSLLTTLDCELDRAGRAKVEPTLNLANDEHVFVIGDVANFVDKKKGQLPGMAPVAIQQGGHVAKNILAQVRGKKMTPFEYFDKGQMATIGRASAVAETKRLKMKGFIAWLAWLFIHLMFLIGFRSKISVLMNWAYSYLAFRRSTRLIVNIEETRLGRALLAHAPDKMEGSALLVPESQHPDGDEIQRKLLGDSPDELKSKPKGKKVLKED